MFEEGGRGRWKDGKVEGARYQVSGVRESGARHKAQGTRREVPGFSC